MTRGGIDTLSDTTSPIVGVQSVPRLATQCDGCGNRDDPVHAGAAADEVALTGNRNVELLETQKAVDAQLHGTSRNRAWKLAADAELPARQTGILAVANGIAAASVQVLDVDRSRGRHRQGEDQPSAVIDFVVPLGSKHRLSIAEVAHVPHQRVVVDHRVQRRDDVPVLSRQQREFSPSHLCVGEPNAGHGSRFGSNPHESFEIDFELTVKLGAPQVIRRRSAVVNSQSR